jgi:hypothetical protein
MEEHCAIIFGLVAKSGGHHEIATRSARAVVAWQRVFDIYFSPISGVGRAFTIWTNRRDDLNKFRKAVLGALEFHAAAFDLGESAPTQVQILANDLRAESNNAISAHDAAVIQQEQHRGILLAANWQHCILVRPESEHPAELRENRTCSSEGCHGKKSHQRACNEDEEGDGPGSAPKSDQGHSYSMFPNHSPGQRQGQNRCSFH